MRARHDDIEFEKLREENITLKDEINALKIEHDAELEAEYDRGYSDGKMECNDSAEAA